MVQVTTPSAAVSTTRRISRKESSSTDPWMLFLVKVLFVVIIILMLPKLVDGTPSTKSPKRKNSARNKRFDKQLFSIRASCRETCRRSMIYLEEAQNCIHECMSQECYLEVYRENPLENGEIDIGRFKEFEGCVREEMKQERARVREEERLAKRAANNV